MHVSGSVSAEPCFAKPPPVLTPSERPRHNAPVRPEHPQPALVSRLLVTVVLALGPIGCKRAAEPPPRDAATSIAPPKPRLADSPCARPDGRYRYSDRGLLRFDRAPETLDEWTTLSQCAAEGRCTPTDGACVATSDAECRASQGCRWLGLCAARGGRCVAADGASCRFARVCGENGRCAPVSGECRATSDADCRASLMCRKIGWCSVQDGLCRVAKGGAPHGEAMRRVGEVDATSGATRRPTAVTPTPSDP